MTVYLDPPPIIGISPAIRRALALADRFAPTDLAVLLVGATGTGKELFARHIHYRSRRRGDLIDVNCGAIPHEMTESLLFGHRRGAFTGAVETATGHLERASGGTLFLDEVLYLSVGAQVKLLRALENGEVQPLGESRKRRVDLRVVSAAQDDAGDRMAAGGFRRDLFQRLAGVVIDLPRLVDRPDDILPLAEHFARVHGQVLASASRRVLESHDWPGNVRELRLAIERAGCLVEDGTLPPEAVRDAIELGRAREPQVERRSAERRSRGPDRRRQAKPRRPTDDLIALCRRYHYDARRLADHYGLRLTATYARLKAAGISLRELKKSDISLFRRNSTEIPKNRS